MKKVYGKLRVVLDDNYYMVGDLGAYNPDEGEEIIHNDKYSIPIEKLLRGKKNLSVPIIQGILSENGYYGRSYVKKMYMNDCYPLNYIRIKIDLVWGGVHYWWPYQGMFSLSHSNVESNKDAIAYPDGIDGAVEFLQGTYGGGLGTLMLRGGYDYKSSAKYIQTLEMVGLFKGEVLKVASDNESEEVIANLFTEYK